MENLMEQMFCKRIDMLLNEHSKGDVQEEAEFNIRMEVLMGRLDKELKDDMERFLDDWIARSAENIRYLYFSGIKDGIGIFKMILGI